MRPKLHDLFETPERARNTVLTLALVLGSLGFSAAMITLLFGR